MESTSVMATSVFVKKDGSYIAPFASHNNAHHKTNPSPYPGYLTNPTDLTNPTILCHTMLGPPF